ncbi:MAG TPA: hypothetical protein ENI95_00655 [Chloroflexi bacterium]|nr:hypothetical protein [Chloroflexota bacterium]
MRRRRLIGTAVTLGVSGLLVLAVSSLLIPVGHSLWFETLAVSGELRTGDFPTEEVPPPPEETTPPPEETTPPPEETTPPPEETTPPPEETTPPPEETTPPPEETTPPPAIEAGDFRTQTQGGWGSEAQGENPGAYRDEHFSACFPDGLIIGHSDDEGGFTALFTTAAAIEAFLPAGGEAGPFAASYVDPDPEAGEGSEAGVLAGQALALTLNIGFDQCDPDFGASDLDLAALIVADEASACFGWTVQQVLDEANLVLGGGGTLTPSEIGDCVAGINENFVDGTAAGSFLRLP